MSLFLLAGCGELPVAECLKRAQADLDAGKAPQAIARLEKMLAHHPKDNAVMEALAFAQLNSGDAAKAGELFNTLGLQKDPDNHLYAAQAYKKSAQNDKAIEAYRLYLLSEPKQATPWTELGELLIASDKKSEGIAALAKAGEISLSPELAERIGTLYSEQQNPSQAQRYLQNALKQSRAKRGTSEAPAELEGRVLVALTTLALDQKKASEAERHLKQLERDFPQSDRLADLKAKLDALTPPPAPKPVEKKIEKVEKVEEKKETAVSQNKAVAEAKPEAKVSEKSAAATPAKISPSISARLTEALSKDSANANLWTKLAAAKADEGDFAWAESAYLEAMRLKPNDEATILAYLEVVKKGHSPVEFLREAESQMEHHDDLAGLYLATARGYRDLMQNKRNASIIFNRFLKKFPTHPQAAQAKAELEAMK